MIKDNLTSNKAEFIYLRHISGWCSELSHILEEDDDFQESMGYDADNPQHVEQIKKQLDKYSSKIILRMYKLNPEYFARVLETKRALESKRNIEI